MELVPRSFPGVDGIGLEVERRAAESRRIDPNAPLLDAAAESTQKGRLDPAANASDQKEEPQNVGQNSRGDQKNGGDKDQDSVHHRPRGKLASLHLLLRGTKRSETLPSRQKRAQEPGDQKEQERRQRPQPASELDQKRELERWHEQEQQKKLTHGAIIDAMKYAGLAIPVALLLHAACDKTQALVLFEEMIPLEVRGLPAGEYRVVANGVAATFRLDVDNG